MGRGTAPDRNPRPYPGGSDLLYGPQALVGLVGEATPVEVRVLAQDVLDRLLELLVRLRVAVVGS